MTDQEKRDMAKRGYTSGWAHESDKREVSCNRSEHDLRMGATVIGIMANCLNAGNERDFAEGMVLAMQQEHRTLQQNTFRALCRFIELYADQDENMSTDARNKASYELANKLAEITSTHGLPLI